MKAADRTGAEARRALWLRRSAEAIVVMRSGSRWAEGRRRDASLKSYRRWSVELLGTSSIVRGTNPVRTLLRRTPPSALRRAKGTTKNKAGIDGNMIGLWCVAATFNCCVFLDPSKHCSSVQRLDVDVEGTDVEGTDVEGSGMACWICLGI